MRRKKSTFKWMSFVLAFSVIFSSLCIAGTASVSAASLDTSKSNEAIVANRTKSFIEDKINTSKVKITIHDEKTLRDFSGNEYTLVECNPKGYYIVHPKSGIIVESSVDSKSPYTGYDSGLYYGGPTYYYVKSGNNYIHTILKTTLSNVNAAAKDCNTLNSDLVSHANQRAEEYLAGKSSVLAKDTLKDSNDHMVSDPNWFESLTSGFGYVDGGYCGYIAANLILKYSYFHSSFTLTSPYYEVNNTALTQKLISIGGTSSSWALPICNAINTFCGQQNDPQKSSWHVGVEGLVNEIYSNQRPVILFGNLQGAGNHAVVVYGYNEYENPGYYTFICHYGWNGDYSNVHIYGGSSTFGSNTQYNFG